MARKHEAQFFCFVLVLSVDVLTNFCHKGIEVEDFRALYYSTYVLFLYLCYRPRRKVNYIFFWPNGSRAAFRAERMRGERLAAIPSR